jgi:hypothetical protein
MDDIETINKFGVDETYIFIADSSKRDKAVYPSASEYEVTFNAQFRNVVKFEILQASVARTDYLVDESECTISYAIGHPKNINTWQQDIGGNIRTANITPGDYNLPQLIDEMNKVLAETSDTYSDTTTLRVSPVTNPAEISNKVNISSSGPFTFLGDQSTIKSTIGFGDPVVPNQMAYSTVPGYNINFPNGASNVFLSKQVYVPGARQYNMFVGVFPPGGAASTSGIYTGQSVRQYFTAPSSGVPASVSAYFRDVGTAPVGGFVVDVAIKKASDNSTIAYGNIVSNNDDLTPSGTNTLTVLENFLPNESYYVDLTPGTPGSSVSSCTSLYHTKPNLPPVPGAYIQINGDASIYPGELLSLDVVAGAFGNNLVSPGIVNIKGARYLKIRCLELETLIYKDRVGEPTTAGVGIVNIIGYGFAEARYSFSSIPVKSFHPIGKLQKLTFRIERPDGSLYNSNGVDNTFLCALTFRSVPNNSVNKTFDGPGAYPAAPGYTGDYIQLQQDRWKQTASATYPTQKATYDRCRTKP